ncbi:MAG: hypothetical protein QGH63_14445, partial [Rhodospirillales bacterium]|nr:hypothetical protein [Rhodospirillales bacterium]
GKGKGKIILTSAQQKAFKQFRAEMLSVRKQLRDVQLALRKDIEKLDTQLKILNIWTIPVVIAIIALVMMVIRRQRYKQQIAQG